MTQLNQILAVEKGQQTKANDEYTTLYRELAVPSLWEGLRRTYRPSADDGVQYPAEYKGVQRTVAGSLDRVKSILTRRFDLTLTKDFANTSAKADIVVDGKVLIPNLPVTYLLFLEKQMVELLDFAKSIPTLDPAENWRPTVDTSTGWFTTEDINTLKSKKVEKVVELSPATKEHPAQVAIRAEDILDGTWTTSKFSGAVPAADKQALLDRLNDLTTAIKFAREKANTADITQQHAGEKLLEFVFAR